MVVVVYSLASMLKLHKYFVIILANIALQPLNSILLEAILILSELGLIPMKLRCILIGISNIEKIKPSQKFLLRS